MINRIQPFLNKLIPTNLAFKGLQKLDPRIGKFLNLAGAAYGTDVALDFLRDKFDTESSKATQQNTKSKLGTGQLRPDEEAAYQQIANSKQIPNLLMSAGKTAAGIAGGAGLAGLGAQVLGGLSQGQEEIPMAGPTTDPLKIFEATYPDIAMALANTMQQGQSPQAAAGILKTSSAFGKKVKDLEKEVGRNFVDFVSELFQGMQKQGQQSPQRQIEQQSNPNQPQGQQMAGNGQQTRTNSLDQQIMAALDRILKM
jgi:hypothetical protein